jgi:Protein of unknown function (DUF732)
MHARRDAIVDRWVLSKIRPAQRGVRHPHEVGPGKWATVCAVLLSAAALLCPAPASADSTDDSFIAALENYGIDVGDTDTTISHGHAACAALDNGQDSSLLALKLVNDRS